MKITLTPEIVTLFFTILTFSGALAFRTVVLGQKIKNHLETAHLNEKAHKALNDNLIALEKAMIPLIAVTVKVDKLQNDAVNLKLELREFKEKLSAHESLLSKFYELEKYNRRKK